MKVISSPLSLPKLVIGVVDDDPAMRAALVDLLDSAGFATCAFGSADAFIMSGAAERSDVIITDIQMPGSSGLDLLQTLQATIHLCPPVIVITALTDQGLEGQAIKRGCFAFLRKPFDPETLLGHINTVVTGL
ncbi:response regulator (plasmid) [Rhizobium sp. WL3]|uniref:response regulator transcription factor n=1 Tax=Rhizobium sp. WL3 TaxID=2603277 RepID=UPI0011C1DF3D|nr:response regulator [Rhizobium sp. WL3]QEE43717.1 response regulator [Rhizobium sp. WL3]